MKFTIRFKIGNRFGTASKYTLREFCLCVVDRYSLTETEICTVVTLQVGEAHVMDEMIVKRVS